MRLPGDRSKSRPAFSGAHMNFRAPNAVPPAGAVHDLDGGEAKRLGRPCASAVAGTMASSNGSAIVTPMPLSTVGGKGASS